MITIVMPYYDNPKMLRLHLHEWSMFTPSQKQALRAVIVDDGSPNAPAEENMREYGSKVGFPVRLFRIVPNIPWNQDGARNLGMKNVETDWALMTDIDHMVSRHEVSKMLDFTSHKTMKGQYYMPHRVLFDGMVTHPHPNSYIMNVSDFWSMGGYDEDFAGVYGSDGNFRKCMKAGLQERVTPSWSLTLWPSSAISDANTKDFGRKDSKYHRSHHPKIEAKAKGPAYKATNHLRFDWREVEL